MQVVFFLRFWYNFIATKSPNLEEIPVSVSHQASIFDNFINLTNLAETDMTRFFKLISEHIDLSVFIPAEFYNAFYKHFGRKRKFALLSLLNALLVKTLFKIPTVTLLIAFINASPDCAKFCNLSVAPDATKFSQFMTCFSKHVKSLFDNIVAYTMPLRREINAKLASTLIFDTTGVIANVHENNPKFVNAKIKNAKKLNKKNPNFNAHAYVYSNMPKSAAAKDCKVNLGFFNGAFAYAHPFAFLTDGLGLPLDIAPLDKAYLASDNPHSDKNLYDSAALKPVVTDFLNRHPDFDRYTFIADAALDRAHIYDFLLDECGFRRVAIPINPGATKFDNAFDFDKNGFPFCHSCNKPFKFVGSTKGKNRAPRFKFLCPLAFHDGKKHYYSACLNPCSDSNCRARYVNAISNRRLYPGEVPRGTDHFKNIYKQRVVIERTINSVKCYSGLDNGSSSRNVNTVFSNLIFGGIASLVILILAKKLSTPSFKSFNQLLKAA